MTSARLLLVLTLIASPVHAATLLDLQSDPGDPIGEGGAFRIVVPDAVASRTVYGSAYVFIHLGGDDHWVVEFRAARGEDLRPGFYGDAIALPFGPPHRPGMRVYRPGGHCDTLAGHFAVLDVVYGEDPLIDVLAVNFELRCDGAAGSLRGVLRLNSDLPETLATPTAVPATPIPPRLFPVLVLRSQNDEYIGGERSHHITPLDGDFTVSHHEGRVLLEFEGGGGNDWRVALGAPWGAALLPGVYEEARGSPGPHRGGLFVSGQHRACTSSHGRFVVHEADFGPHGAVERLAVDFEYHCESLPPALFGHLRIDSDHPIPAPPAATPTPASGRNFIDVRGPGAAHYRYHAGRGLFTGSVSTDRRGRESVVVDAYERPGVHYTVSIGAPLCTDLEPGHYEYAATITRGDPADALLDLSPGCANNLGQIDVLRFRRGTFGELYEFEARYESSCHFSFARVLGHVRYESTLPTPTPAPPSPTPSDRSRMAVLYSDPGDFIGGCRDRTLDLADGAFLIGGDAGLVEVVYAGTTQGSWWFQFYLPGGRLRQGRYPVRHRYPGSSGEPEMSISGEGRGCNRLAGAFTVHEIEYGAGGDPQILDIEFEQHCEESGPALRGWLRYGVTAGTPTPPATRTPTRTRPSRSPTSTITPGPSATIPSTPTTTRTPLPSSTPRPTSTPTPLPHGRESGLGCHAGGHSSWGAVTLGLLLAFRRSTIWAPCARARRRRGRVRFARMGRHD